MNQRTSPSDTSDDLLTILADGRCRAVLTHFRDAPAEVASLRGLADAIGEHDQGGADRTAAELHHAALPRLAGAGVVDYDARSRTVRHRGHAELEALLDGIGGR